MDISPFIHDSNGNGLPELSFEKAKVALKKTSKAALPEPNSCVIPLKQGIGGESRPKDRVTLRITLLSVELEAKPILNFGDRVLQGVFTMTELCAFMSQQLLKTPPLLLDFTENQSIRTLSSLSRLAPHSSFSRSVELLGLGFL
jgi:hypothetical protein